MDKTQEYVPSTAEGQEAHTAYHELLETIERNTDPRTNTVLIVDDSKMIRMAVSKSITENDKRLVVVEAADGQEALARLAEIRQSRQREPLFIVTDLEMPVMDGWTFIEKLKEDYQSRGLHQGIPVIVLSSSSGEKGLLFFRKSVHGDKSGYNPLVTVAKAECLKAAKYDAKGEKGLKAWVRHFLRYAGPAKPEA
jgi:CheY-like chemotaxis protein